VEHYGFVSVLPPLIAIILAIATKQVILSLFIGISVGVLIYSGWAIGAAFKEVSEVIVAVIADDWRARVLLFTMFLGGVVGLVQKSGGFQAFAEWAGARVKSRKGAQMLTWLGGVIIFFDDYFNCLAVGSVMRPLTDKFRVSREKLSYIVDSTAAPVCILIPISTWVAYVVSLIATEFENAGIDQSPFVAYLNSIPLNLYALAAVVMVVAVAITDLEFGPMRKAEERAIKTGEVSRPGVTDIPGKDVALLEPSTRGGVSDMFIPILTLVIAAIAGILYTGGFFEGATFSEAMGNADSATALVWATLLANMVAVIWYVPRGVVGLQDAMDAIITGIKAMMPGVVILVMAWAIGAVAGTLGTGAYVTEAVGDALAPWIIPIILFVVSCFISFATGTSWGTFAIMIPIGIPLALGTGASVGACIGAMLGGGVFGDHCSPISDTTVLSSTGSQCNHIDHVTTQIPYAVVAAVAAGVGYIIQGFTTFWLLPAVVTLGLLLAFLFFLHGKGHVVVAPDKAAD
jgi:Na+/H+ antiporter NhaC